MNRANERKFHYIYKITRHDGKYYIGMHSTDNLEDGYFGSGQLLWKSIKKHGKDKHTKEILEHLSTREALKLRERELVNEEILTDKLCMNLKLGGEGGGGFWSPHHHLKCQLAGSSKGGKAAMAKYASLYGARSKNLPPDAFAGRTHTAETKKLIAASLSVAQAGSRNSQFGTCWVCKERPIKIKKHELAEYLANGFQRGRKFTIGQ